MTQTWVFFLLFPAHYIIKQINCSRYGYFAGGIYTLVEQLRRCQGLQAFFKAT
uniref:Uncharacterized protein n=1 Tax=Anguilla anguilla TaxID=7936 RepID=A0A0E9QQ28_ANGAN